MVHGFDTCKGDALAAGLPLHRDTMLARFGFVASVLSENISTSNTCRLKNATPLRLRELIATNLDALYRVTNFLERHRILLYRISSNVIPFASHPINQLQWWEEFAPELATYGQRIRALDVRVSTHPGQFTVLNSPSPAVVTAAIAELQYQARLLDAIGAHTSAKIVVHIGGLYAGAERTAMDRFCAVVSELPPMVRRRLVVENDDRLFDAEEVLSAANRVGIPVVFDWLHHNANPCRAPLSEVLPAIFATWKPEDGRPKLHLSSQAADGPPGAHARYVRAADALALFAVCPDAAFDCMLEAKEKDRALLKLRADLRRNGVVESEGPTPLSSPRRARRKGGP